MTTKIKTGRQSLQQSAKRTRVDWFQGDELLSYLQISQLTFTELQGFLALQCVFDGALVRLLFALLTPTGPWVVLLGCCVIEAFLRGTGGLTEWIRPFWG